jgi:sister chromatid cohesion protein PDS5
MPGTRRRRDAAAEETAAEPMQDLPPSHDTHGLVTLQFKQPLSWKVGKAIPVAELLSRLEKLFKELESIEQDTIDRETLLPVAGDLAHQNLISHRDKGVRAFTACCLVELFRLCAPDAPFTEKQLKVRLLPMLHDIS